AKFYKNPVFSSIMNYYVGREASILVLPWDSEPVLLFQNKEGTDMKRIFSILVFSCLFFLIGIQTSFAETDRIRGAERFETAVEISKTGWESSEYVIIANGFSFPDALAGGPLAYPHDAPILLTRVSGLSDETKAESKRLSASKAIILGGTAAISEDVVEQLEDLGLEVERIGGKDRYITAALISEKISSTQAVLANGMNF